MEDNVDIRPQEQDIAKDDPNSTTITMVADTDTTLRDKEQSTVQTEDVIDYAIPSAILNQTEPHSKEQNFDVLDDTSSTNTTKAKEKSNCCNIFNCLSRHDIALRDEEQSKVQNEDVIEDTTSSANLNQTEPHSKEQDNDISESTSPNKRKLNFDKCKIYLGKAWNVTGIYLFLFDQGTDIYAAYKHIVNGDIYWGCLTILFFSLPIIVTYIKDTYKDIQECEGSVPDKWFLGISGFFMAPIRPFYLIVDNVVNKLKDKKIDPQALRNIWIIKLLEALLESLPQAGLQLYVILLRGTVDIWQWITVATSLLALSFMVSTNTYLFKLSAPAKSRAVFFFLGIITVLSRLAVFAVYVGIGKQLQINTLWLLPLGILLFVSISVWFVKRFCLDFINQIIESHFPCCKPLKPLSEVGHHIQIHPKTTKRNISQNDQNSPTKPMASNMASILSHDEEQSTVQNEDVIDDPNNIPKAKEKSNCCNMLSCLSRHNDVENKPSSSATTPGDEEQSHHTQIRPQSQKPDIAQHDPKSDIITKASNTDGGVQPHDDDENDRSASAVVMCWVLTAAYNSFTKSGLLLSTLNFMLAMTSVHLEANLTEEKPFESVLIIIPATFSLVTNLILVLIPYFTDTESWNIGDDWLNIDEKGETMLY